MKKECIYILFLKFYSNELLTETKKNSILIQKRERSASKIV
jgi:hypothetical protein